MTHDAPVMLLDAVKEADTDAVAEVEPVIDGVPDSLPVTLAVKLVDPEVDGETLAVEDTEDDVLAVCGVCTAREDGREQRAKEGEREVAFIRVEAQLDARPLHT